MQVKIIREKISEFVELVKLLKLMSYYLLIKEVKRNFFIFFFGHEFDEQESGDQFLSLKFFFKTLDMKFLDQLVTNSTRPKIYMIKQGC